MGFSLQAFINGLKHVLDDGSLNMEDKLKELQEAIKAGEQYAKECGQL